VCKIR